MRKKEEYRTSFNPGKKGLQKILGKLESQVMGVLWAHADGLSVREVHTQLSQSRSIAYTTVMTVMARLAEKGVLERTRLGNAFIYRAAATKEQFTNSVVSSIVRSLVADFASPAIHHFVDSVGRERPERMEELARAIEARRKKGV